MGYTHYFEQMSACPTDVWDKLCNAFPPLAMKSGIALANWDGKPDSPPDVNADWISFNGVGPAGHETFKLTRDDVQFHFCKTAQKPYDVVCVAMLCLAHTWAPGVWRISSDGDPSEWAAGLALAKRIDKDALSPLDLPKAKPVKAKAPKPKAKPKQPKHPRDCTVAELVKIVVGIQEWMYVEDTTNVIDGPGQIAWYPDKEINGADFVDYLCEVMSTFGLAPDEEAPVDPHWYR